MKGPYPLHVGQSHSPLAMYVHDKTDTHISHQIANDGVWEIFETTLIQQFLFAGAVFVDVGANIGYYSVVASPLVGDEGKVFAFEPERDNFFLLTKNVEHNELVNVHPVNAALSDGNSEGKLHLNLENRGDHQIYSHSADASIRETQSIHLLEGNRYLSERVKKIDVLKIDTQGAEFKVVQGLLPLIKKSLPGIKILMEFSPLSLQRAGSSGMALLDLISTFELPTNLVDHLGHTLIPMTYDDMAQWINATDNDEGNEGFINLLLGL